MSCQVVWLKRDLRDVHHAALSAAMQSARAHGDYVIALYVREPSVWAAADASARQWGFVQESLRELKNNLAARGIPLLTTTAEVLPVLQTIHAQENIRTLWAHQETGVMQTFNRDKAVAAWCREHAIGFQEFAQQGVKRGLQNRRRLDWSAFWETTMAATLPPDAKGQIMPLRPPYELPRETMTWYDGAPDISARQRGGREAGLNVLQSFLQYRAPSYRRGISSPISAQHSCSRLSPYLSWGCLSIAEVAQATQAAMHEEDALSEAEKTPGKLSSLKAFFERLAWHCHFIQKFETEPAIETENMHRGFDGLRETEFRRDWFDAWCRGETGWPMMDACMKCLNATGWINFRMRAMLLSTATYPLWLHWREPALYLARQFVDYEPGIHFPQVQMQAGVTGINAMRVYHPTKQARDHDTKGAFIRQWLPALANVPDGFLAEPWTLTPNLQQRYSVKIGHNYPTPLTDLDSALRSAKNRMAERRAALRGSEETERVLMRLASRKRSASDRACHRRPAKAAAKKPATAPQLSLW